MLNSAHKQYNQLPNLHTHILGLGQILRSKDTSDAMVLMQVKSQCREVFWLQMMHVKLHCTYQLAAFVLETVYNDKVQTVDKQDMTGNGAKCIGKYLVSVCVVFLGRMSENNVAE